MPPTGEGIAIRFFYLQNSLSTTIYLFTTVQPDGMPDVPVGSVVIEAALVNMPVDATPLTQLFKQFDAEISVASIVTLLSELQSLNMLL